MNYSIDMLKKSAFIDELSELQLTPITELDEETMNVIEYFEKRIKELNDKYAKSKNR